MDLAYKSKDMDEFIAQYYDRLLDWTSPNPLWDADPRSGSVSSVEILPVTLAILHLCKGDVNDCISEGASFGRDCDTIARAAGSIAGAMQGAKAIRPEWIETVETSNDRLFDAVGEESLSSFRSTAQSLLEALRSEQAKIQQRADFLNMLLEGAGTAA